MFSRHLLLFLLLFLPAFTSSSEFPFSFLVNIAFLAVRVGEELA